MQNLKLEIRVSVNTVCTVNTVLFQVKAILKKNKFSCITILSFILNDSHSLGSNDRGAKWESRNMQGLLRLINPE